MQTFIRTNKCEISHFYVHKNVSGKFLLTKVVSDDKKYFVEHFEKWFLPSFIILL